MHRCYVPLPEYAIGTEVRVVGDEAHHARRVLRLRVGDSCEVFNGLGCAAVGSIVCAEGNELTLRVERKLPAMLPIARITLAVAVPKGTNMELIVQKSVEMGVARIFPLITERTIVRLSASEAASKTEKWRRIALEACKQCGVNTLPKIERPLPYSEFLGSDGLPTLRLQCALLPKARPLREVLEAARQQSVRDALLLIGPEGDFSPDEYERAGAAGYTAVSLGPIILRVESAVFTAVVAARYALDPLPST